MDALLLCADQPGTGTRRVGIIPPEDASQRYLARLAVVTVALA
jgi:hypothetical protein